MIDENQLRAQIQAEYSDTSDPKHQKTRTRYVIKKIESEYKQRENSVVPFKSGVTLKATKEIQQVAAGVACRFEGHIREDVQVEYASKAELRNQQKLALVMDHGKKGAFRYAGSGQITVTLSDTAFPHVEVGQYLKATVRGQDPVTRGVRSITKTSNDTQTTYCKFEAKVDERTIQASSVGGVLAFESGVEWILQDGDNARAEYATNTVGPIIGLLGEAVFDEKIKAGDFVEIVARTGDPSTVSAAAVGFYRVVEVGHQQIRLSKEKYDRQSEGVYTLGQVQGVNFSGSCNWRVIRTVRETPCLRHSTKTFQGVQEGDWVRVMYVEAGSPKTSVWKVASVPVPGLILLSKDIFIGAQAPYVLNGQVSASSHFTHLNVTYGIYRAIAPQMATFRITDTKANFASYVQQGDFVTLINRTSGLDATQNPGKVPGVYRVASVPNANVLNLENRRYEMVNGDFVPTADFYGNLTDVASYEVHRFLVLYPYAALYKVASVDAAAKSIVLDSKTYSGYGGYAGDYREEYNPLPPFEDVMDFEVISTFTDKLFLIDKNADFLTKAAVGDFVHLVRRTVYPPSTMPDTTGIFKVEATPLKTVLFLDRVRHQGSEPHYQESGRFSGANSYRDDCDYRITRVFASEFSSILATHPDPVFAEAKPGYFLTIAGDQANSAMVGTWMVESKLSSKQLKLASTQRYLKKGDLYEPHSEIVYRRFDGLVDFSLTRYAEKTTKLEIFSAENTSSVQVATVANGTVQTIKDIAKVSYNGKTQLFAVISADNGYLRVFPRMLTGSSGNYQLGNVDLAESFEVGADFEIIRAVSDLDDVLTELRILKEVIPSADVAAIDRAYDTMVPKKDRTSSSLLSLIRMVVDQIAMSNKDEVQVYGQVLKRDAGAAKALLEGFGLIPNDPSFILKKWEYQQAVALAAVIDHVSYFLPMKFVDLKDKWVDARLRERGYKAAMSEISNKPIPQKEKAFEVAINSARLSTAVKIRESIEEVFRKRNRPDLIQSIGSQLDNMVALFFSASQPSPLLDLVWVRDMVLPGAAPLAIIMWGIDKPEASMKRSAIAGKIGVPADRSVRAIKRSHSIKRNRRRFYEKSADDLARHRDSATKPGLAQMIGDWIAGLTTKKDQEAVAEATDLAELALRSTEMSPINLTAPDDQQATSKAIEASMDQPASTGAAGAAFQIAAALSPDVMSDAGGGAMVEAPAPAEAISVSGGITNLFSDDFQDFRRTGIVMPLDVIGSAIGQSNRDLLASISITDSSGNSLAYSFDLGEAGTHPASSYNHFMLMGIQEQHAEKYQIMDTLSDGWVAFGFGKQPEVWSINGLLVNDMFSDQLVRFRAFYDKYLGLTELAKEGRKMRITVPAAGIDIWCYGINLSIATDVSQSDALVPFTMQILVSGWKPLPLIKKKYPESVKMIAKAITEFEGGSLSSLIGALKKESSPAAPKAASRDPDGPQIYGPPVPANLPPIKTAVAPKKPVASAAAKTAAAKGAAKGSSASKLASAKIRTTKAQSAIKIAKR